MYNKNVYKYDEMKRSEHMTVRTTVGWYLWTHQLIEITGTDVNAFMDRFFANPISNLSVGRERYTTMLNDAAEIMDDVIVFRKAEGVYWVSTLFAKDMIAWFDHRKGDLQVEYRDVTAQYHMYAIQGPKALDMMNAMLKNPIDDLRFYSFADFDQNEINGMPVMVNRAGFTGEKVGYELYIRAEDADAMEDILRVEAEKLGGREVTEFQVMAWTLPTEAGFYYMRDLRHCNPLEVELGKGINWEHDFIGRDALLKVKEAGPEHEMVGFTIEEADIRIESKHLGGPGYPVYVDGEEVGRVSKLVYGYVKETNIGYIFAKKGALKPGDKIMIHGYEAMITEKRFM